MACELLLLSIIANALFTSNKMHSSPCALNIYGLYQTGKSLLSDSFSSSDFFLTFDRELDFDLLRYPGGIFDLYLSILSCDPLIAGRKFSDFSRLVKCFSTKSHSKIDSFLFYRYSVSSFSQDFDRFIAKYLHSLRNYIRTEFHPFLYSCTTFPSLPFYRILNKFLSTGYPKSLLLDISPDLFVTLTTEFFSELFHDMLCSYTLQTNSPVSAVVFNNACFPGQEQLLRTLCPFMKNILVIRDPLLCYQDITGRSSSSEYVKQTRAFFDHTNPYAFFDYYEQRLASVVQSDESLIIRFEDLISSPANTLQAISDYTSIELWNLRTMTIKSTSSAQPLLDHTTLTYFKDKHYNHILSFYPEYAS